MSICFTLRHSFLAEPFSCKFHYTVGHKYHHSKIRFEHTLKHNLHFFGSSRLALLVPNVCILNQLFQPKNIKISTRLHSICFNISINLRKCIVIWPFEWIDIAVLISLCSNPDSRILTPFIPCHVLNERI